MPRGQKRHEKRGKGCLEEQSPGDIGVGSFPEGGADSVAGSDRVGRTVGPSMDCAAELIRTRNMQPSWMTPEFMRWKMGFEAREREKELREREKERLHKLRVREMEREYQLRVFQLERRIQLAKTLSRSGIQNRSEDMPSFRIKNYRLFNEAGNVSFGKDDDYESDNEKRDEEKTSGFSSSSSDHDDSVNSPMSQKSEKFVVQKRKGESAVNLFKKEQEQRALPRKEVIRTLREHNEPIRLFAETEYEVYQRFRRLESLESNVDLGNKYDFQEALVGKDQVRLDEIRKLQGKTDDGKSVDVVRLIQDRAKQEKQSLDVEDILGESNIFSDKPERSELLETAQDSCQLNSQWSVTELMSVTGKSTSMSGDETDPGKHMEDYVPPSSTYRCESVQTDCNFVAQQMLEQERQKHGEALSEVRCQLEDALETCKVLRLAMETKEQVILEMEKKGHLSEIADSHDMQKQHIAELESQVASKEFLLSEVEQKVRHVETRHQVSQEKRQSKHVKRQMENLKSGLQEVNYVADARQKQIANTGAELEQKQQKCSKLQAEIEKAKDFSAKKNVERDAEKSRDVQDDTSESYGQSPALPNEWDDGAREDEIQKRLKEQEWKSAMLNEQFESLRASIENPSPVVENGTKESNVSKKSVLRTCTRKGRKRKVTTMKIWPLRSRKKVRITPVASEEPQGSSKSFSGLLAKAFNSSMGSVQSHVKGESKSHNVSVGPYCK